MRRRPSEWVEESVKIEYYKYLIYELKGDWLCFNFAELIPKWINQDFTKEQCLELAKIEIQNNKIFRELIKLGVISSEIMPGLLEHISKDDKRDKIRYNIIKYSFFTLLIITILLITLWFYTK